MLAAATQPCPRPPWAVVDASLPGAQQVSTDFQRDGLGRARTWDRWAGAHFPSVVSPRHACSRPSHCGSRPRRQVRAVLLVLGCELHFSTLSTFIGCRLRLSSGYIFCDFDSVIGKQVCQRTCLHTGCVCSAPRDRGRVHGPLKARSRDACLGPCRVGWPAGWQRAKRAVRDQGGCRQRSLARPVRTASGARCGVRDLARGGFGEQRERRDCTVCDVASNACYDFSRLRELA